MNEDRLTEASQKFDAGMKKLDEFIGSKAKGVNSNQGAALDAVFVEHSFGGVPIPKAPIGLGDLSGMVLTDHDEGEDILLGS